MCTGCSYDNDGRHYKTNEGLTKLIQDSVMRRNKMNTANLNSPVRYLTIPWTKHNSKKYTKAIEMINDCYRKMLMIGKSKEVF